MQIKDKDYKDFIMDEWVKKFKDAKIDSESLDDEIIDLKTDEASEINNGGLHSQIKYLLESCGENYLDKFFKHLTKE